MPGNHNGAATDITTGEHYATDRDIDLIAAIAIVDVRNTRAGHLVRSLGFRQEAHHIKNVFFKGAWGDEWVFAMLGEEWPAASSRPWRV